MVLITKVRKDPFLIDKIKSLQAVGQVLNFKLWIEVSMPEEMKAGYLDLVAQRLDRWLGVAWETIGPLCTLWRTKRTNMFALVYIQVYRRPLDH